MNLDEFLQKNNIRLPEEYYNLAQAGWERMKKSLDPHHDDCHLRDLFSYLHDFLRAEAKFRDKIDFSVLLPALSWHDAWKAGRGQSWRPDAVLFREVYEGFGSARMLKKYINKNKLDIADDKARHIRAIIRRHCAYRFFLPQYLRKRILYGYSPEGDVLRDLDRLGTWSIERLWHTEKHYREHKLHPIVVPLADLWLRKIALGTGKHNFAFPFFAARFAGLKRQYLENMLKIYTGLYHNPERYFSPGKRPKQIKYKFTPKEYANIIKKIN